MQQASPSLIDAAASLLRNGGLVAFPTETVYGLGANAADPLAVRRIFAAKGRPADHPLIVHLHDPGTLDYWARDIPEKAYRLAESFWPGPLTLILKRGHAPLEVTGGQDTVGLRVPNHPVALKLLEAFGGGVAAPSANRFGRVSPTRARHVRAEMKDKVDLILDGGPCSVGVESTILSLAEAQPRLLRPGAIAQSALEEALGDEIVAPIPAGGIRAPGMLDTHYAPLTRFEVWPLSRLKPRGDELMRGGMRTAAIFIGDGGSAIQAGATGRSPLLAPFFLPGEPAEYARKLYAVLRLLDTAGFDALLAEAPPSLEAWRAVNDRLKRAACVAQFTP
ncbi:MAG: L-threonylcarbamoyladenylate synthase [Candidatus Methylumidiphilus sp.]